MRKKLSLGVLLVLAALLANLAWSRWGRLGAPKATLEGRFPTEEQWIVAEIAQDVAEMAFYAVAKRGPGEALAFSIQGPAAAEPTTHFQVSFTLGDRGRLEESIVPKEHIWSPEAYEKLARAALARLGLQPAPAPPSTDEHALEALVNLRARVIETQNQRVSARLARDMLDPEAHEEAALVLGALLLREGAGYFWDVRQLQCRMTAHLALARALRGGSAPGTAGRYAETILTMFCGRSADAIARLGSLRETAGASESQAAWLRALTLTITGDWRALPDPWKRTLLEKLSYFKAVRTTLSSHVATDFYQSLEEEPIPDWGRLAFQWGAGTEGGLFSDGIEMEVAEARDLWSRIQGRPLPEAELISALNRPAERCVTADGPRVIAWGTWAASLQRHICHRVLELDSYLRHAIAIKEQANATLAAMDRRFGGLQLYPFVQALRWLHGEIELESFVTGMNAGVVTAARQPELLNPSVWTDVNTPASYGVLRRRMPDPHLWFAQPVPAGTVYDAWRRLGVFQPKPGQKNWLATFRELDPWHQGLVQRSIQARATKPTLAELRQEFGPRAEYDLWALSWMLDATEARSPEREGLLEQKCRLLPDECIELARYLVALERDTDAAKALRRAFDAGRDRVYVANVSTFLVRHYHDRGQAEEATRIAEHARGTGSARGITAMALLQEWRGNYAEAEELYTQIERRYDDTDGLLGFYHRMVAGKRQAAYQAKLDRLLRKTFPDGLERLDPAKLPAMPGDGLRFSHASPLWGLQTGDIAVAANGWRIHGLDQFSAVRQFDHRPELVLHVWHRGQYSEIRLRTMDRYLGVGYTGYP